MNKTSNVDKGKLAEGLACEFLTSKGFMVLCRNYYTRFGEIDVVFEDGEQLVFCEVKAKYTKGFGLPEDEFDARKHERFNHAVLEYLMEKRIAHDNYRIDLIAMQLDEITRTCRVKHYKAYY